MGCHPSHWRTPSFFKMVKTTNQNILMSFSEPKELLRATAHGLFPETVMPGISKPGWTNTGPREVSPKWWCHVLLSMDWFKGQLKPESPFFPWENLQVGEMMIVVNEVGFVATLCIVMWSSHSNINCLRSTKYIINSGTKKNWSNFTVGTVGMNLKSCKTARGNSMRWNGKKEKHCCSLDECVSSPAVLVMWRHLSHGRRKVRKRRRSKRRDEVSQVMGFPQSSP